MTTQSFCAHPDADGKYDDVLKSTKHFWTFIAKQHFKYTGILCGQKLLHTACLRQSLEALRSQIDMKRHYLHPLCVGVLGPLCANALKGVQMTFIKSILDLRFSSDLDNAERAGMLFCCEALEMFCGLQSLT